MSPATSQPSSAAQQLQQQPQQQQPDSSSCLQPQSLQAQSHTAPPQQQQQLGEKQTQNEVCMRTVDPTCSNNSEPCRMDLSGQLMVIQQQLLGSTAGDNSTSTFSQVHLLHPQRLQRNPQPVTCMHSNESLQATNSASVGPPPLDQQQQPPQSRKRSRPSCQYGNYHHYYGYRLKPSGFEDPRLRVRGIHHAYTAVCFTPWTTPLAAAPAVGPLGLHLHGCTVSIL